MNRYDIAAGGKNKRKRTKQGAGKPAPVAPNLAVGPPLSTMVLRRPGGQEVEVLIPDMNLSFHYEPPASGVVVEMSASFQMTQEQARILMGK